MAMSEELGRLDELRQRGVLTDDEFARAKATVLGGLPPDSGIPALAAVNALRRSRGDRWIAGVCGGLARATGAESWLWRLVFAVFFLCGGLGLVLYLLMWLLVPVECETSCAVAPAIALPPG